MSLKSQGPLEVWIVKNPKSTVERSIKIASGDFPDKRQRVRWFHALMITEGVAIFSEKKFRGCSTRTVNAGRIELNTTDTLFGDNLPRLSSTYCTVDELIFVDIRPLIRKDNKSGPASLRSIAERLVPGLIEQVLI